MTSTPDFLDCLRRFHLLEPSQLDELTHKVHGKNLDPRSLAQKLVKQGWLTPYQVNQLLQGRGQQLLLGSYGLSCMFGTQSNPTRQRKAESEPSLALRVVRFHPSASA